MNRLIILLFSFVNLFSHYQDIIVNNIIVEPGSRECLSRYEPIKKILDLYKRPITVLDIGASQGFYSFKIANDYNATCIMIEGDYNKDSKDGIADQLENLCHKNENLQNIIFLKKHITYQELQILSECEHFDVVLALNVIHHFGSNWKQAANAILNLGDNIIIQTPPLNDKNAAGQENIAKIEEYLKEKSGTIIGSFPRQTQIDTFDTMFWFKNNKDSLKRIHWANSLPEDKYKSYKIESDFNKKVFTKVHLNYQREWHSGINLYTFKMLNGVWPTNQKILDLLKKTDFSNHNDVKIWNIIIQGQQLVAIDGDETKWDMSNYGRQDDIQRLLNHFR